MEVHHGCGGRGESPAFATITHVDPFSPGASQPHQQAEPTAGGIDERALIAAIVRKDRKAAAHFVAAHIDAVYTYARHRLTARADLVDDVVQEVFLGALRGLAAFQGQSSLRTWLLAIARHKIEDVYRRQLRAPGALDDLDSIADEGHSNATTLDDDIDRTRRHERARRVLAGLPDRYAMVLLWRYWEHRSTREIATAIGTTDKSVERLLARARGRFKELWAKE